MSEREGRRRPDLSVVVTTYGGETAHTQGCLGWIRRWKKPSHEVVVVAHDESPTLRAFLEYCRRLRIIDRLVLAEPGHGHVRGVNLGFALSRADTVFNVCIDMRVGGAVIDDCSTLLHGEQNVGMVGWHYDWNVACEGSRWRGNRLETTIRRPDASMPGGRLLAEHVHNIRAAPWFTGRVLEAVGDLRFTCCNGSFFGIRRDLWERLGGFDERLYPVHFADDFLTYAVLDQGLDVLNLPRRYRCRGEPSEFLALTDLAWQGRPDPLKGVDRVTWQSSSGDSPVGELESAYLGMVGRALDASAAVLVEGDPLWRPGAGVPARDAADLIVCGPGAYRPGLERRLRAGGLLILAGPGAGPPGAASVGSLRVLRAREPRARFVRELSGTPQGGE